MPEDTRREGISVATAQHIVEELPGPAVVHLESPWGALTLTLDDREDKALFKPGQEYYMKPKGARTPEEEEQQARRLLDHLREVGRLGKISDAALVNEVLDSAAADDLGVVEMMNRLVPKWHEDGRLEEFIAMAKKHWRHAGLYDKYRVAKRTGKPVDPEAEYFVLRLDKDPHAVGAALAYASSVEEENEALAEDLREAVAPLVPLYLDGEEETAREDALTGALRDSIDEAVRERVAGLDETKALRERVEELEATLRPFAEAGEETSSMFDDDRRLVSLEYQGLRVKHVRQAAEALATGDAGQAEVSR